MEIIVAPDSFKGSLTAIKAAEAMAAGIHDYDPTISTLLLPAADGGEGTMNSLIEATNGNLMTIKVLNPLGRIIEASYGILGDEETCVVEIAEASGLMLLDSSELNPMLTSSFGTGELILHALNSGYRKFIIGLGGSATNDGGAGMLQALGMRFTDKFGKSLPSGGGFLGELETIDTTFFDKRILKCNFMIACDVENPLVGANGASSIFGPQKGANQKMVDQLDMNLNKFADVVEKKTGQSLHYQKSAGAAGGAGGAFMAFFPAEIRQGITVVMEAMSFGEYLKTADIVFTGEGKTDAQTLSGKTPFGIAWVCHKEEKPVILISGEIERKSKELLSEIFSESHAIMDDNVNAEDSIEHAYQLLRLKTMKVIKQYIEKKNSVLLKD